jgi:hypothetical protein
MKSFWRASAELLHPPNVFKTDPMNSPSAALVWEIWRKNRWGFVLLIVLLAVCAGLSQVVVTLQRKVDRLVVELPLAHAVKQGVVEIPIEPSEEVSEATTAAQNWREGVLAWSVILMGFSFLVVCAIFSGAETHTARGFTGIPPRRFTLPVRTSELVGWPIVLRCLTIVLGYFAWSHLVMPPLLPTREKLPDFYYVALLCTGLVGFQALVWGLSSFPRTRICLIILFVCGGLPALGFLWSQSPSGVAVIWMLSVAAAWFGVEQERRGGWRSWQGPIAVVKLDEKLRPPPFGFSSAFHAQFWIEWRRNGRLALGVLVLLVASVSYWSLLNKLGLPGLDKSSGVVIPLAVMALAVWLVITGLNLGRDAGSKRLALSSFSATRPLATGTLVTAKLLAGAAIWISAVVILALGLLCFAAMESDFRELPKLIEIIVPLAVAGHLFVGILPLCLSGRIPGFPWSLLPLLLIYGAVINAATWFGHHEDSYGLLFALLTALLVLKLAVAFWGFRRALGLKLVSVRFVVGYVGLWMLGAGILVALAVWYLIAPLDWANDAIFLLPAALLAVPLARIALAPLALAMNRHR